MPDIVVFGDSISDTGNFFAFTRNAFPPSPPYFQGRFSNGPLAVEYLATQLGSTFTLLPANNFAFAGATTGTRNSIGESVNLDLPGLTDQLDRFAVQAGTDGADPDDLHVLWAGPNNFLGLLSSRTAVDPAPFIHQGALDLRNALVRLATLGAENLVLPNMVNLGRLPETQAVSQDAAVITRAFNAAVALEVGNLSFTVTEVDLFAVTEAIATNPAAFGFTNVTTPLLPLLANLPDNPETFFFWDSLHPTTQGHAVLGNTLFQTITGVLPQPTFNPVIGTDASETLTGTVTNDNMDGLGGSDRLLAGLGDDRLEGWAGADTLLGGLGNDLLSGNGGSDTLRGGLGDDIAFGGHNADQMAGEAGADILIGDGGNDELFGMDGNDYLLGGQGQDTLRGNAGEDTLQGGFGRDILVGGVGDDRLDGGSERDRLIGGPGTDTFVFRPGNGSDALMDFQQGQDRLDLSRFGFTSFANFRSRATLRDDAINFGGGDSLRLLQVEVTQLSSADVILA